LSAAATDSAVLMLKPGKEKSLKRQHPWIFSGAIASVRGNPASGATVRVHAANGDFLAHAAYSPQSQIRARAWNFDEAKPVNESSIRASVNAAVRKRDARASALRLIHGEADGFAGLVVDRYENTAVMQVASAGGEAWREVIADALLTHGIDHVYERSDAEVRTLEGFTPRVGVMRGSAPDPRLIITEQGRQFHVDIAHGHKTGFYLDQADNRSVAGARAQGAEVLNCFCYTGGFSVAALKGGARHVLSIDSAGPALELARANLSLNGIDAARAEWWEADVFKALRDLRNAGRMFDMVILDPPKFAPTPASVERAARAYKDINLLGLKLTRPGGTLLTFSCSGGVSVDLFQKIVAGAAADAAIAARIDGRLSAGADHPVLLSFPEGEYLKGLALTRL
jgi:23S rRNA (cytosine1962-C5)-methyltransferase